jgi:ferredoxin
MPKVTIQKDEGTFEGEVPDAANLIVRAGIKQFPFPHLNYGCGMGKCSKCTSQVLSGMEQLPPPNWKEKKILGPKLDEGYRLICQLWVTEDLVIKQ